MVSGTLLGYPRNFRPKLKRNPVIMKVFLKGLKRRREIQSDMTAARNDFCLEVKWVLDETRD